MRLRGALDILPRERDRTDGALRAKRLLLIHHDLRPRIEEAFGARGPHRQKNVRFAREGEVTQL